MTKNRNCLVTIGDKTREYPVGTSLEMIAQDVQSEYPEQIVLAYVDGKLRELFHTVKEDCQISFEMVTDSIGVETYKRSVVFLLSKAICDLTGRTDSGLRVKFSLDHGLFCTLRDERVTEELLAQIEGKMRELVEKRLPIKKVNASIDEAIRIFQEAGLQDKVRLFQYRTASHVNLYYLEDTVDYFYGHMLPGTGYIRGFRLDAYADGFILQLPQAKQPDVVLPPAPSQKLYEVRRKSSDWGEMFAWDTVGEFNELITKDGFGKMILLQEALMEKQIVKIAEDIASQPGRKFILIAGPSSSGKTTFSYRLSIQLAVLGIVPHPIAVDDYFVEREDTPRDENGQYDFECLEAVDTKLFNQQMKELLEGKKVDLPTFDFTEGKKVFGKKSLQMQENDVLVIEGIHCLNPKMTEELNDENKYKIYISALVAMSIDEHNPIQSTDGRLLRRIVRDARTRGASAQDTIRRWPSVRNGEEKNIFPYREEADVIFNSTVFYELAVLKPYVESRLFGIDRTAPEYLEAKKLLKFLDYIIPVGSEDIPKNSLIREFVGGGCFGV